MFDKGVLPFSGGILDQANKYIVVMEFIDDEIKKHAMENKPDGRE